MILTVSQASRRDILQHLDIAPAQVRVVYSAPAPHFQPVVDDEQLTTTKKKYDLPDRYILYVGGYDAHKNIDALLQAFAQMPPAMRARYPLVLAGTLPTAHTARRPDPRRQIRGLRLEGELSTPGRIAAADLPAVYSGATLFVYPSSYEGFGLPVLEAMACGTAVLTTTAASLPEVAGGAAWFVAPNDVAGLTAAIISLCTDREQNQAAVQRGLAQARRFSWQQTAAQTLQAYWDAL
jgi:alpha-1,3-rhamnosyl/mannosyltransferase